MNQYLGREGGNKKKIMFLVNIKSIYIHVWAIFTTYIQWGFSTYNETGATSAWLKTLNLAVEVC